MDSLRIALEISMTKISQPRRRRRRHSLLFWYLLPLPSPVSIKAVDTIEAAADMVVTDDTDAADAGFPKFEPVRIKRRDQERDGERSTEPKRETKRERQRKKKKEKRVKEGIGTLLP